MGEIICSLFDGSNNMFISLLNWSLMIKSNLSIAGGTVHFMIMSNWMIAYGWVLHQRFTSDDKVMNKRIGLYAIVYGFMFTALMFLLSYLFKW